MVAAELARLQSLLADPTVRLLTILGPGGVGKSRLALALIEQVGERYPHGACFVPLAPLTDPALLPQAIAAALHIGLSPEGKPAAQVLNWLRDKQLLLVLDNFEHLRAASAWLQELLAAAPGLQLLVTSREQLHLAAEWLFDLPGLAVPPATAAQPADWAAGALFAHWLRRTRAGTAPDPNELSQIAAICAMVEGLPLAIELAASWARTLSCAEIARELAAGNDLLVAATPALPERHASIRTVFDHSWRLLSAAERQALERCAVFRGGFTAELAATVADAPLPLLAALIDKTLLRRSPAGRLGLHGLACQYAEEQLARHGLLAATRDRHLAAMIAMAEQGDQALRGPDQFAWYQRLAAEEDNLRAALDWAAESGQAAATVRLAGACGLFWLMRSHVLEGYQLLQRSLEQAPEFPVDRHRHRALFWAGRLAQVRRDPVASRYFNELLAVAGDDTRAQAYALLGLGDEGWSPGHYRQMLAHLESALERFRICADKWGEIRTLAYLAQLCWFIGNYARTWHYVREGLACCEQSSDRWSAAWFHLGLGMCHFAEGNHPAAADCLATSLAIYEWYGDRDSIALVNQRLGMINLRRGRLSEAATQLEQVNRLKSEIVQSHWHLKPKTEYSLGLHAFAGGDVAEAETRFLKQIHRSMSDPGSLHGIRSVIGAFTTFGLAPISELRGDEQRSLALATEALRLGELGGQGYPLDQFWIIEVRCNRARILTRLGDTAAATEIYTDCLEWYAEHADRYGLLLCLRGIAVLAQHCGNLADAVYLAAIAERLSAVIEAPLWPVYQASHQAWIAELQATLPADVYATAWATGNAASLEPDDLQRLAGDALVQSRAALSPDPRDQHSIAIG